jgi:hypothetical protein
MRVPESIRRTLFGAAVMLLFGVNCFARTPDGKEILYDLSWADQFTYSEAGHLNDAGYSEPMNSPAALQKAFHVLRDAGVDIILFRIDTIRMDRYFNWPEPKVLRKKEPPYEEWLRLEQIQWEETKKVVKENLVKSAVDAAHQNGLKIYAYHTVFDEGMPLNVIRYKNGEHEIVDSDNGMFVHDYDVYSPMISKFTEAHPEYVRVDRSQKEHNWGSLEFAYPEARDYVVSYNKYYLDNYAFDGTYVNFRNEFGHPDFADQFGFAPPIVAEYQKRYGVDIRKQQFDLDKWRKLCGEYLTQFIRELYAMTHANGKLLMVGVPQGNYLGIPTGNLYVDWQDWAKEHIVDALHVGVDTYQDIYPDRIGYGYLTDQEKGIGLPNYLWDLQTNYYPLCAAHGVKLYAAGEYSRAHAILVRDLLKLPVDGVGISGLGRLKDTYKPGPEF